MRGSTTKRLKIYANFLKTEDPEKYKDLPANKIYKRLQKIWKTDKNFQKFIRLSFSN